MRRLLLLCAFSALAFGADPAYVSGKTCWACSAGTAFNNLVIGNEIIVGGTYQYLWPTGVTSALGNVFTEIGHYQISGDLHWFWFKAPVTVGGNDTITITGGSWSAMLYILQYSGVKNVVNAGPAAATSTGSPCLAGSITTTKNKALVIGGYADPSQRAISASAGWNLRLTADYSYGALIDQTQAAAGAITPSATCGGSGVYGSTVALEPAGVQVSTPFFTPTAGGTYYVGQTVSIGTATTDATIRYTTDGSTPTHVNGTLYTGPVVLASTVTIKAIGYKDTFDDSDVASGVFTVPGLVTWNGSSYGDIASAVAALKTAVGTNPFTATQTILVSNAVTTYPAVTLTGSLFPTATYRLEIKAAPGQTPIIDCGSAASSVGLYLDASGANSYAYTTIDGLEIRYCSEFVTTSTTAHHGILQNSKLHDSAPATGWSAIRTAQAWKILNNEIYNTTAVGGVIGGVNGTDESTGTELAFNKIYHHTGANGSGAGIGAWGWAHDNLIFDINMEHGACIWASEANSLVETNIGYACRYGGNNTGGPSTTFSNNIFSNNYWEIDFEGGSGSAYNNTLIAGTVTRGVGLFVGTGSGSVTAESNIFMPYGTDAKGISMGSTQSTPFTSDFNNFYRRDPLSYSAAWLGSSYYTLANWRAGTGQDAHGAEVNPRFLGGDPALLQRTDAVPCTIGQPTIAAELRCIRAALMPTNLGIRNSGTAGFSGAIAPTVFNSPGAIVSTSPSFTFSGGVAF